MPLASLHAGWCGKVGALSGQQRSPSTTGALLGLAAASLLPAWTPLSLYKSLQILGGGCNSSAHCGQAPSQLEITGGQALGAPWPRPFLSCLPPNGEWAQAVHPLGCLALCPGLSSHQPAGDARLVSVGAWRQPSSATLLGFPICKTKPSRLLAALQTQHLRILVSGAPAVWKTPSQQV